MAKTTKITKPSHLASSDSEDNVSLESALSERIEHTAIIGADLSGLRFDQIAAKVFPDYSRGKLQTWISSGELTVNGKTAKTRQKLFSGAELRLSAEFSPVSEWQAEDKPINIVFEDEHLLVINKADNCVVHPAPGLQSGTLVNSILAHCPSNAALPRGGIVHRLDRETSGVMLIAKTQVAFDHLKAQFRERTAEKEYHCIVYGTPRFQSDWIERAIGSDTKHPERMTVVNEGGRESLTYYEVVERFDGFTHVMCRPKTGRTHQIRVHMTAIGHSLVGDRVYRSRRRQHCEIPELAPDPRRHCLHALRLTVPHPLTQEPLVIEAPMANDMELLLAWLRQNLPAN